MDSGSLALDFGFLALDSRFLVYFTLANANILLVNVESATVFYGEETFSYCNNMVDLDSIVFTASIPNYSGRLVRLRGHSITNLPQDNEHMLLLIIICKPTHLATY